MNKGKIEVFQTENGAEIQVKLEKESVWLDAHLLANLFNVNRPAVVKHIKNIYNSGELSESSTCSILEQVAADGKNRKMNLYNLDVIISVGYRVNSKQATQFRQWATQRLKDYLVQGYAINEKRLQEKQQEVEYLKTGIRILSRAIEHQATVEDSKILKVFARGLDLLDDFDHQQLDKGGNTDSVIEYPSRDEYLDLIQKMRSDFNSDIFALPKDESFDSSINQIKQSFNGKELYPSVEKKAAVLLYLIVKNHSFVDGNKRIGAACFLLFLERNNLLFIDLRPIISNEALVALTLFVATSQTSEMDVIVNLIVSILNRSR